MNGDTIPLVHVLRADVTETVHRGAAAIVDAGGRLVAHVGDPDRVSFARSSAKPLQALTAAEAGAFERFEYSNAQIALATGSHTGEAAHIAEVKSTMAKLGIQEDDLICPASYSSYEPRRDEMIRAQRPPTRLHHNCSGKHCAMVAAALTRNEETETYFQIGHPHQQRIVRVMAEMGEIETERIRVGVDNCGAPALAMPLRNMALAYARLTAPEALSPKRAAACDTIRNAMTRYPYLVGGSERFDTLLLATGGGSVLSKGGAEGYFAAGVRTGDPARPALGIALKIEDGNYRAACQTALEILHQLGVLAEAHRWRLAAWRDVPLKDPRGETIGAARAQFDLVFGK